MYTQHYSTKSSQLTAGMKTLIISITISAVLSSLIQMGVHPNAYYVASIVVLGFAMSVDLVTGIIRSKVILGEDIMSKKLERTIIKMALYGCVIICTFILSFLVNGSNASLSSIVGSKINNAGVTFLIYRELISICENVIEADKNGWLAMVFKPVHLILTWKFKSAAISMMGKEYDKNKQA